MDKLPTEPIANNRLTIADALEECRLRLDRGASVEACVAAFPSHADELRALLPLVVKTRRLASEPDPLLVDRSRRRFRAYVEAKQSETRRSSGPRAWLWRLVGPVVAVLVLTVSSLGLSQASANTLPDSPLYTVKQARETLGQMLTVTPAARASYQITLSRRRLNELQRAELLRKPAAARTSAAGMVAATQQAVNFSLQSDPTNRKLLEGRLRPLIQEEIGSLEILADEAPPRYAPAIRQAEQRLKAEEKKISH